MYNPTEHRQSTGVAPSAARGTFTAFGARHVKGVAVSRWVAAVCFVIAGALVVAFGHWWGLVFFVAAGLNGSLAYLGTVLFPPGKPTGISPPFGGTGLVSMDA